MRVIYLLIVCSFVYSECDNYSQSQCGNDNNCEWVEDIETGNCGNLSGDDCELNPECNWNCDFVDDYMGWCNYSCDGGPYEIDNSYCQEIEMPECNEEYEFQCTDGLCIPIQRVCNNINDCEDGSDEINCEGCSEMIENQCDNNDGCEWTEDIDWGSCGDLDPIWNVAYYCDDPLTNSDNCYTYTCYGGGYGQWGTCCGGDPYIISDNGYCEDVEMLECSEMNETECSSDDGCDWIEDINNMSCSSFSNENCVNQEGCFLDQDCNQWGSWYSWICYDYGPVYCSGNYQEDNSYCEEVSIDYQLGDVNSDYTIDILDIIAVVNLILDGMYVEIADMNSDARVNILDVIDLISIVLNTRR